MHFAYKDMDWKLRKKQIMDPDQFENVNNYNTFQANSGAIRFTMIVKSLPNFPEYPEIYLIADECPHEKLYSINFDYHNRTININLDEGTTACIQMPSCLLSIKSTELWLSWYKNKFGMGLVDGETLVEIQLPLTRSRRAVGFITFRSYISIIFNIKDLPIAVTNRYKQIDEGELRWVTMSAGDQLPTDALIGGYESEPIYIARAKHNRSLCPGKFVPSKQLAFIPWGHQEHAKRDFEILCGYNLMWVKCKSPHLPDNVFVAGTSEVRNEPLYIGRAMIDDDLVVGKVHMLYESCYLPYHGKEICSNVFEVIAVGNSETCESNWKRKCFMLNCRQPC